MNIGAVVHKVTGKVYLCLSVVGEVCEVISADDSLYAQPVPARRDQFVQRFGPQTC